MQTSFSHADGRAQQAQGRPTRSPSRPRSRCRTRPTRKTGETLNLGKNVNGQAANPKALEAVQFALKQLGKPYVFGAEGPDSYDCSGLTWASYRSVGVTIPRIADYQEHALHSGQRQRVAAR